MSDRHPLACAALGLLAAGAALAAVAASPADPAVPVAEPVMTEIQVTARRLDEARNGLMPEVGTSAYKLGVEDLKNLPLGDATPLNEVLLRAPGVTQDSFGQLHVRGDHANLQYRINDVVIPESISLFGQALNPRFASEISLLTGALPAQYGYRTAGVVDIHTKGSDYRQGVALNLLAGSREHREFSGEWSGSTGPLSFYGTGSYLQNNSGIENPRPTASALHDHTGQGSGFGYLSYLLAGDARVSLMLGASNENFEIPTLPGQSASFVPSGALVPASEALDQRQHEGNRFVVLSYENAATESLHYQVALYDRLTDVHYRPDVPGDLYYTGASGDVSRRNARAGVQADASWKTGSSHTLRFGLTYNDEQARSRTRTTVYPLDDQGGIVYQSQTIAADAEDRTRLAGVYLQDEWHPTGALTVNYGARYDRYEGPLVETQLSPRLGIVYELGATTIHAGYARYFTPPPSEKISVEAIALFAGTTAAPASTGNDPVRSERSHYIDIGVLERLSASLSMGLDAYYRRVTDLGDEGQFGPALIFAPFNYADGRVGGIEFTGSWRGAAASAYLNVAYGSARARQIVSGQYNFPAEELAAIESRYIALDHDQRWTASSGLTRQWLGFSFSGDALFGSGLRRGFINSDHLPSYLTFNLAARRSFDVSGLGAVEASVSVLNLFDHSYELRDGSGVGVGAPQWGLRRTIYVGLGVSFGG
jgi:outer membrane receptor for ferrienterochelin and colicin